MIPRGRLSISFKALFKTIYNSFSPKFKGSSIPNQRYGKALFCLSARTAIDLSLRALKLPPESGILAANINIPDMFTILKAHKLIIQPIFIERETLNLSVQALEKSLTSQTKAILVTHLFGGIAKMDEIIAFAKRNKLLVIEDCAQAFNFDYIGHPESDIVLFSFGLIKTNTCLTGAMVRFSNEDLFNEVARLNEQLPQQETQQYRLKLIKAIVIKIMTSTYCYTLIYEFTKWMKKDFDDVLASFTKGFPGEAVMQKIRFRPCNANLQLLKQKNGSIRPDQHQQ
jgi:perosamine synthetase